jgi:hypothetical protein
VDEAEDRGVDGDYQSDARFMALASLSNVAKIPLRSILGIAPIAQIHGIGATPKTRTLLPDFGLAGLLKYYSYAA